MSERWLCLIYDTTSWTKILSILSIFVYIDVVSWGSAFHFETHLTLILVYCSPVVVVLCAPFAWQVYSVRGFVYGARQPLMFSFHIRVTFHFSSNVIFAYDVDIGCLFSRSSPVSSPPSTSATPNGEAGDHDSAIAPVHLGYQFSEYDQLPFKSSCAVLINYQLRAVKCLIAQPVWFQHVVYWDKFYSLMRLPMFKFRQYLKGIYRL